MSVSLQSIALYQPDGLLASRLIGGVDALSAYMRELQKRIAEHDVDVSGTSRALVVALTAEASGFWLLAPSGDAPELAEVRPILAAVPRPAVVGGPVAFAMLFNLGADFPVGSGPPVPGEWLQVIRGTGTRMRIDDVLIGLLGQATR